MILFPPPREGDFKVSTITVDRGFGARTTQRAGNLQIVERIISKAQKYRRTERDTAGSNVTATGDSAVSHVI